MYRDRRANQSYPKRPKRSGSWQQVSWQRKASLTPARAKRSQQRFFVLARPAILKVTMSEQERVTISSQNNSVSLCEFIWHRFLHDIWHIDGALRPTLAMILLG
jgi:hypothetical protein